MQWSRLLCYPKVQLGRGGKGEGGGGGEGRDIDYATVIFLQRLTLERNVNLLTLTQYFSIFLFCHSHNTETKVRCDICMGGSEKFWFY